jgi:hypothetical protein
MQSLRTSLEFLFRRMGPAVTNPMRLDLLETLTWMLDDNGSEIYKIREEWIREADPEFLDMAMLPWECAVGRTNEEAQEIFGNIRHLRQYQGRIEERLAEIR